MGLDQAIVINDMHDTIARLEAENAHLREIIKREAADRQHGTCRWQRKVDALAAENAVLRAQARKLAELIRHCWIHVGYDDCGRSQMTTRQKAVYSAIAEAEPGADLLAALEALEK